MTPDITDIPRDPETNRPESFEGIDRVFTGNFFLTPAECNPQRRMPLALLINRLIEVATLHANQIGIGFAFLSREHQSWVLSRVAVEMKCYPGPNEAYSIKTWITSVSRLFSERDFEIYNADGEIIGYARTIWAAIDVRTRRVGELTRMSWVSEIIPDRECPVEKPVRLHPLLPPAENEPLPEGYREVKYRFQYSDLDINRHVNSSRYIELLLNQWSLEFHDKNRLTRFDIAYIHEARYDQEVTLRLLDSNESQDRSQAEIFSAEGTPMLRALLNYSPR